MAPPRAEDYEDLLDRVASLERLLRAQASYHAELLAFAGPRPVEEPLITNAEAAARAGMAPSTFRGWKKRYGLEPANDNPNRPKFRPSDVDDALARAAKDQP